MGKIRAAITGVAGYVPDGILDNKKLETMVDTNDEWITTRTGIKERRILEDKTKAKLKYKDLAFANSPCFLSDMICFGVKFM